MLGASTVGGGLQGSCSARRRASARSRSPRMAARMSSMWLCSLNRRVFR
jgi:hypothetical protein